MKGRIDGIPHVKIDKNRRVSNKVAHGLAQLGKRKLSGVLHDIVPSHVSVLVKRDINEARSFSTIFFQQNVGPTEPNRGKCNRIRRSLVSPPQVDQESQTLASHDHILLPPLPLIVPIGGLQKVRAAPV